MKKRTASADDALVLEFGIVAEVHEEPEAIAGGFQVVVKLSAVFIRQF